PSDSSTLSTDARAGLTLSGTTLNWSVVGKLGQYPYPVTVPTTVHFSLAPTAVPPGASFPNGESLVFADPNGSAPFQVAMTFSSGAPADRSAQLPPMLSSRAFLASHDIHFLLWPNVRFQTTELAYYGATFGYRTVYQNPEWLVLAG
ncbi:MAG TPA: hypothetical protein VJQ43_03025, partial [Thermoplasmata archaeon]|nr:hypothetical protein [Thermoplasmata archaeon]